MSHIEEDARRADQLNRMAIEARMARLGDWLGKRGLIVRREMVARIIANPVRPEKVAQCRAAIAAGTLETDAAFDVATHGLMEDLA